MMMLRPEIRGRGWATELRHDHRSESLLRESQQKWGMEVVTVRSMVVRVLLVGAE